ncbi:MAG: hypothetical protein V3S69_05105 [Dehalococcoidales bacterium]
MAGIGDALLGLTSGAASVINKDAEANREFMRKHKAKIAESQLIRQEKAHDAKRAKYSDVQEWGTGETGQYMHMFKVLGDHDQAVKALKDPAFAAQIKAKLEAAQDPGEFTPYNIGMSDESYRAQFGQETIGSKLLGKFSSTSERRKTFRDDEAAGRKADSAAIAQQAPVPVETELTSFVEEEAKPIELQTTKEVLVDNVPTLIGVSKDGRYILGGEAIEVDRVSLKGEDRKLSEPEEVMYNGEKVFARSDDATGMWMVDGVEVPKGSVIPLADKPSALLERIDMIPVIDAALLEPDLDPDKAATLERQRAIIMGNISPGGAGDMEKRARREGDLHSIVGTLETSAKNIDSLAHLVTAEHGGLRALATKVEDRLSTYYEGLYGSNITAQNLINRYTQDGEYTPAEAKTFQEKVSNAYEQGQVGFMAEMIKYDVAEALKRGDRLTANDLERVDSMITAPFGSDEFAAQLGKAQELVSNIHSDKVKEIMIGRQIPREDIEVVYNKKTGEKVFLYKTIVNGELKRNRFKL